MFECMIHTNVDACMHVNLLTATAGPPPQHAAHGGKHCRCVRDMRDVYCMHHMHHMRHMHHMHHMYHMHHIHHHVTNNA